MGRRKELGGVFALLAAGSTISALGYLSRVEGVVILAGYVFLVSAVAAFAAACARLYRDSRESDASGNLMGLGEP